MRDDERSGERNTRKEYAGEEKRRSDSLGERGRRRRDKEGSWEGGRGDRGIQLQ